jgi:hypothetical protein
VYDVLCADFRFSSRNPNIIIHRYAICFKHSQFGLSEAMKRKVQSACVEDVDPQTEEVIQGTQNSASIYAPAEESRERRKAWRKSGQHLYECRDSEDLGPMLEFISNYKGQDTLTIIAGKHDDNKAVWAEYEEVSKNSSTKQRIIHLQGAIQTSRNRSTSFGIC